VVEFGEEKNRICFTVLGYEFEGASDRYDRNWLNVEISGIGQFSGMKARSAALLTWELRALMGFVVDEEKQGRLDFIEPDLEFTRQNGLISIELRYGIRLDRDHEVQVFSSMIGETWQRAAILELEKACVSYPER
jgi:hypothetical protein